MSQPTNLQQALAELKWLQENPDFDERPASIEEFLGDGYLNIKDGIREGVKQALVDIFGTESSGLSIASVQKAIFTGGIGIGKTTLASIALPYMCHWILCLRDPQKFLGLLPGSRIAFMMMSTSEDQAKQVLFGDVFARINHSTWFKKYPYDPKYKSQIRFPKDIWIVPGDSADTTFEGYNILGGVIDEIDSHKITPKKDYADTGYDAISNRISSRFQDRGLILLIGQMKKTVGFAARKYKEFLEDSSAAVCKMTIWESLGWARWTRSDGTRDSFWFDPRRKIVVPTGAALMIDRSHLMEVPSVYLKDFNNNPEKALRDLAGIPPIVGSAFIGMPTKIYDARDRWVQRYHIESPVRSDMNTMVLEDWFRAPNRLRRAIHIDLATSSRGDALGFAMGHVPEVKEVDSELVPVIVFDLLFRMKAIPGTQIILSQVRQFVYHLRDDRGFRISSVTLDGFQSTDTMQQLTRRRFLSSYLSVDRQKAPYQDLLDALYEDRVEFPPYVTHLNYSDLNEVEIAIQELEQLVDNGQKIDHPDGGSKDVADAMAGVVYTLMGDKRYRRGVSSTRTASSNTSGLSDFNHNGFNTASGLVGAGSHNGFGSLIPASGESIPRVPIPPSLVLPTSSSSGIPKRLRPR